MQKPVRVGGRAFTLVELLVAVGAFAIVTVSVATIFASVGDTISAGRRQSRLNNLAAQVERVMRQDFERMARDGFLVIRHEYAVVDPGDAGDADNDGLIDGLNVLSFAADGDPRPRRADSIMFFARGEFETSRGAVQPGMFATGSEARIWYGHGQRKPASADVFGSPSYAWFSEPRLDDTSQGTELGSGAGAAWDRLGYDPGPGLTNPNEFAADWTLLRHVTVLSPLIDPVAQSLPDFGADGLFNNSVQIDRNNSLDKRKVVDNPFQVALQPAVSSVFWNTQPLDPTLGSAQPGYIPEFTPSPELPVLYNTITGLYDDTAFTGEVEIAGARTASGLTDIATTDLNEIMSVVNHAAFDVFDTTTVIENREDFETELAQIVGTETFPRTIATPEQMRNWMINALPSAPIEGTLGEALLGGLAPDGTDRTSPRVRYEPSPPEIFAQGSSGNALLDFYNEVDKEVLTRSAFVPRCTEFIVEWSYGWTYGPTSEIPENASTPYDVPVTDPRYKQLVWFGRDRYTDDWNTDGVVNTSDRPAVHFYERRNSGLLEDQGMMNGGGPPVELLAGRGAGTVPLDTEAETVVFGRFWASGVTDGSLPGTLPTGTVPLDATDRLLAWPWPELIRVTMTIADPGDPSIESTIEVVFEVPAADGAL